MSFISVGYGNIVNADRIISVSSAVSAPSKRTIQEAKDTGRCIDVTQGRRTKSIIIMDSDHVILSALHVATIAMRIEAAENGRPSRFDEEDDQPDDGDDD
ncbi:MAG: DUF370 domain-containing protein [Clostridia bacterium]|nr:DUF370 domain-containing protein [Clostridia bacterium]